MLFPSNSSPREHRSGVLPTFSNNPRFNGWLYMPLYFHDLSHSPILLPPDLVHCIFITPQAAHIAIIVVFIPPCVASSPARVQRAFLSPRLGYASPRGRVHRRDPAVGMEEILHHLGRLKPCKFPSAVCFPISLEISI